MYLERHFVYPLKYIMLKHWNKAVQNVFVRVKQKVLDVKIHILYLEAAQKVQTRRLFV